MHWFSALAAVWVAPLSVSAPHLVAHVSGDIPCFSMQSPVQSSTAWQAGSLQQGLNTAQQLVARQSSHLAGKPIMAVAASSPTHAASSPASAGPVSEASASPALSDADPASRVDLLLLELHAEAPTPKAATTPKAAMHPSATVVVRTPMSTTV